MQLVPGSWGEMLVGWRGRNWLFYTAQDDRTIAKDWRGQIHHVRNEDEAVRLLVALDENSRQSSG